MSLFETISIPRIAFSIISDLFAAYFIYMYRLDKDSRKLIAAIAFIFLAGSSALQIVSLPTAYYFVQNFISLEFYPMTAAVLIILFSEFPRFTKNYNMPKYFYLSLVAIAISIFIPLNYEVASSYFIDGVGLLALATSIYLFVNRKQLSHALILLAIASFLGYGLGWTLQFGLPFIFLIYGFGFIFVALAFSFVPNNDKSSIASVFRISKKLKDTTKRLRELNLEYETVFDSVSDAIFVVDAQTNQIVSCNIEAGRLFGMNKDEILGANQLVFFGGQIDRNQLLPKNVQRDKTIEMRLTTKNGSKEVAIKTGCFVQGHKKFFVSVLRDISLAKAASRRVELMNEKLRVVGGLTRHDVRNKLSAVTGYAYILKKKYRDLPEVINSLSKIEQVVAESSRIFDFAKMYEQLGAEELTYINVEGKLKEAQALLSGSMPSIFIECPGLVVLADSFLRQLFYNLMDNTRKYGLKATTIKVYYEKMRDCLKLIYEDDGVGVSVENKVRLFKEGFSTGGSSGYGLFLTKKMIEVYGWKIEETGEPGKGVKFTITIPILNPEGKENFRIEQPAEVAPLEFAYQHADENLIATKR